jgi:hypothetical protein
MDLSVWTASVPSTLDNVFFILDFFNRVHIEQIILQAFIKLSLYEIFLFLTNLSAQLIDLLIFLMSELPSILESTN